MVVHATHLKPRPGQGDKTYPAREVHSEATFGKPEDALAAITPEAGDWLTIEQDGVTMHYHGANYDTPKWKHKLTAYG